MSVFTAVTEEAWKLGYLRKKTVVITKCCLDNDNLSNILHFSLVTVKILKQNLDCIFKDSHSKAFCSQWSSSYLNLFLKVNILSLMNKRFSVFM